MEIASQQGISVKIASFNHNATTIMKLDLDRYVPALMTFIVNKISVSASKVYKEKFDVTVTEWRIISMLAVEPDINSQRIIECIGFDKAAVSRNVKGLVEKNLVSIDTDENDMRSHRLNLTQAGTRLHDQIIKIALKREKTLLDTLEQDEVEMLIRLLHKISGNIKHLQ